jgi:prephenate dehydrogenase
VAELRSLGFGPDQATTDLVRAAAGADLVVLATPVGAMPALVESLAQTAALAPGTLVTDVGSVKATLVERLTPAVAAQGAVFVGSHPMAGSENAGLAHAREDLFAGATCLVTPLPETPAPAVERVAAFWTDLGMRVRLLSPEDHDAAIARVSHLPHLAAAALALAALQPRPDDGDLCGNGLRDSTRIAKGAADLWSEILLENRDALLEPVRNLQRLLAESLVFLENRDQEKLAAFLRDAGELRRRLDAAK